MPPPHRGGFLSHSLPKAELTHAADFATALWLLMRRPDILPERKMPDMIRRYNASVGSVNSDSAGYHETITQASIAACRAHLSALDTDVSPGYAHATLMAGPCGNKDWPFTCWTRQRLMSPDARQRYVAPDIVALPFPVSGR